MAGNAVCTFDFATLNGMDDNMLAMMEKLVEKATPSAPTPEANGHPAVPGATTYQRNAAPESMLQPAPGDADAEGWLPTDPVNTIPTAK